MIRKIAISLLILHGIYVTVSNSLINNNTIETRMLEKSDPSIAISESNKLLEEGDMIFRLSMDGYSQFIKKFNRQDKQYSHAGVVIFENGHPIIYHMVNGEESKNNKMVKSSFEKFIDPKKNYAFGIYRNELSENEKQVMISQIRQWYDKGIEFDFEFNLESDEKMYCSEMIAKAIANATKKRIEISHTTLSPKEAVAFAAYRQLSLEYTKNLKVIAIDNLYTHKWSSVVREYRFY